MSKKGEIYTYAILPSNLTSKNKQISELKRLFAAVNVSIISYSNVCDSKPCVKLYWNPARQLPAASGRASADITFSRVKGKGQMSPLSLPQTVNPTHPPSALFICFIHSLNRFERSI